MSALLSLFRYGGISVGGQLPVLELRPQTIQDVAAQMGRLLNVTGVRRQTMCTCHLPYSLTCGVFGMRFLIPGQTLQKNPGGHADIPQAHGDAKQREGALNEDLDSTNRLNIHHISV